MMQRKWQIISACMILAAFLFFRIYRIQETLEFYDDMGRDALVLYDWKTTGKPPLLGPQTSVLPIHQSAVYFYLLFPIFLLSNASAFSAIATSIVVYLLSFVIAVFSLRNAPFQKQILLVSFLWTIYPQLILQQRFVWNPTFVPLFLSIACFAFFQLTKSFSKKSIWIFGISTALAVSLSYSVIPTIFAFWIVAFFLFQKRTLHLILTFIVAFAVLNAPTIIFEFRHQFSISQRLFSLGAEQQLNTHFFAKLENFFDYGVHAPIRIVGIFVFFFIVCVLLREMYKHKIQTRIHHNPFVFVFLVSFLFTLLSPVPMLSHYLFGIITLFFFSIAFLPTKKAYICTIALFLIWTNPQIISRYFQPALRTVAQLESCAKRICEEQKQPLFISVQAGFHPFHRGPEYYFLLKKAGCNIKNIETERNMADDMAVFVDNSTYEHGKTAYHELTLFGEAKVDKVFSCTKNLNIYYLLKK